MLHSSSSNFVARPSSGQVSCLYQHWRMASPKLPLARAARPMGSKCSGLVSVPAQALWRGPHRPGRFRARRRRVLPLLQECVAHRGVQEIARHARAQQTHGSPTPAALLVCGREPGSVCLWMLLGSARPHAHPARCRLGCRPAARLGREPAAFGDRLPGHSAGSVCAFRSYIQRCCSLERFQWPVL